MFCFITSLKLFSDNIDDGWEYKSSGWGNNNHLGFFWGLNLRDLGAVRQPSKRRPFAILIKPHSNCQIFNATPSNLSKSLFQSR